MSNFGWHSGVVHAKKVITDELDFSGTITYSSVTATGAVAAGTTVLAGTTVTAGTGVTSTTGNVTATAGNVVAGGYVAAGTTLRLANTVVIMEKAGVPGAGDGVGVAGPGSLCVDYTNSDLYINAGTIGTPSWKLVTRAL